MKTPVTSYFVRLEFKIGSSALIRDAGVDICLENHLREHLASNEKSGDYMYEYECEI